MKKVCVITCYKQPDYVRAVTLRAAVVANPGAKLLVVKNSHKGALRYLVYLLVGLIDGHPLSTPACGA